MIDDPLPDDKRRLPALLLDAAKRAEGLDELMDHIIAVAVPNWGPNQFTVDKLSDISEMIFWARMDLDNIMFEANPQHTETS